MYPKRIIARADKNSYPPQFNYLIHQHNFQDFSLHDKRPKRIKSSHKIITDTLKYTIYVLKRRKDFSNAEVIITTGWIPIILKILIKFQFISCKRFYWLGFQLHNPKLYRYFSLLLWSTSIPEETYIVNAFYEKQLYIKDLKIAPSKIQILPYSDWGKDVCQHILPSKNYYFAGGYTNRDYASLIETFVQNGKELVIIGSKHNNDLNVEVPDNIKILKDIKKQDFINYLVEAKACILPLRKTNAGASGQMVLLSYMRNAKVIIASDFPSVREYVSHNSSALLYNNNGRSLTTTLAMIEAKETATKLKDLSDSAFQVYQENFSYQAMAKKLDTILALKLYRVSVS
ncbi:MAG: glycosyltransferase [Bacteroidota bacterium]